MVQFYGAPPMALLTVGAGALLLGPGLIVAHAAITIDAVLWPLGTITGLASSLAVPYLMVTRLQAAPDAAFGGWLMPVVPPMVSAATGALLVSHLPAGAAPADHAAGVLCDVRPQLDRQPGGDHAAVAAPGPLRARAGGDGANGVERARPARATHHRREPARRGRPSSASAVLQQRGDGRLQAYFTRRAQAADIVTGALSLATLAELNGSNVACSAASPGGLCRW